MSIRNFLPAASVFLSVPGHFGGNWNSRRSISTSSSGGPCGSCRGAGGRGKMKAEVYSLREFVKYKQDDRYKYLMSLRDKYRLKYGFLNAEISNMKEELKLIGGKLNAIEKELGIKK
jgi:hypothetical protein